MNEELGKLMATFKDYPPAQLPGSFTIEGVKKALFELESASGGK
jgi:hypothetical protein